MGGRELRSAVAVVGLVALVAGCGGGGSGATGGSSGSINIGVRFPDEPLVTPAKIPSHAQSVRVRVLAPLAGSGLVNEGAPPGEPLVTDTIINKPAGGGTATASIGGVHVGPVLVKASAHAPSGGSGPPLAAAQAIAHVRLGLTTTVALSLIAIVDPVVATTAELTMLIGEKAQITAETLDAAGATIIGAPLVFSATDAPVATVSPSGLVDAMGLGETQVTVRHAASGKRATVSVRVVRSRAVRVEVLAKPPATAPSHPVQCTAVAFDDRGRPVPGAEFDWRVVDLAMGSVDSAGLFTAAQVGLAQVVATERKYGVEGTGLVRVAEWAAVIAWDSGVDPDLHVFDDSQTYHAYYSHLTVPIGQLLSDVIAGPGVEAFAGNTSVPGRYPVAVNYFRGQRAVSGIASLLVADRPIETALFALTEANADDGYPVTRPTASWARPFDVIVTASGEVSSAPADTYIALGPPGSRVK